MKVNDNHYKYTIETKNEDGSIVEFQEIDTIEPIRSVKDVHDELDLENNQHIKRIEEIIFDGKSSEYWYIDSVRSQGDYVVAYIEDMNLMCHPDNHFCDTNRSIFEYGHFNDNAYLDKNFFCTSVESNGMSRIYMKLLKSETGYEQFTNDVIKAYLTEHPVTVWYVLRHEVVIPRSLSKGYVISHEGSTNINVQPQTMGKVTPVVKAKIGDVSVEMDSVPSMVINNTTEGNQLEDLTFEGVTLVNNANGDNVKGTKEVSHTRYDFAPFYDGSTTINNTVEGGQVSAKLYGDTMVNIAKPYGETALLTATNESTLCSDLLGANEEGIVLANGELTEGRIYGDTICNLIDFNKKSYGSGCSINYNSKTKKFEVEVTKANQSIQFVVPIVTTKIKPSTKYWMKLRITLPKEDSSQKIGYMLRNLGGVAAYTSYSEVECKSQEIIKTETTIAYTTTHDSVGIWLQIPISLNIGDIITIEAVLLEYSEKIEQLNLSYFDNFASVVNPTVILTNHPIIFGKGGRL